MRNRRIENRQTKELSMFKTSHLLCAAMLAMSLTTSGVLPQSNAQTGSSTPGAVFVMTNSASQNEIVAYKRGTDGSLQEGQSFSTGGRGSGGVTDPLASQGSLTLSQDHTFLLAVNAGSGDISVFRVQGAGLALVSRVPCGGSEPVAVAQRGNLVFVLNAGGASSVVGFHLAQDGTLKRIPAELAYLSTGNSGAASLAFSPNGQFLLVTEKITNNIDAFPVQADGTLGPIVVNASAGPGLFSLLFAPNGIVLATETGPAGGTNASAISSYAVQPNGTLSAISTSVPTLGAATCWSVVTPGGRFVYTSNAGTGTISGYAIGTTGTLTALAGTILATNPAGSVNLDIALSSDGRFLYTLNSGTGTVSIFSINEDGTLTSLGDAGGLSASAGYNGIAAI
jgi:6-phosphogluconolactonase (cycloisomerase 2 family)